MAPMMAVDPLAVARAASDACSTIELTEREREAIAEPFGDASLVDPAAGPLASLTAAARRGVERSGPDVDPREVDAALCELLGAVWGDAAWRGAWSPGDAGAEGEGEAGAGAGAGGWRGELAKRCPLREILAGARYSLSYGDAVSNRKYFRNFGRLVMQATMLQDETRTAAYHRAILQNRSDFEGKVVMDVGSGTGMLAFFAIQAGAARVYCVEASPVAAVIPEIAAANGWADRVVVVNRVLQEIRDEVPERVDCITHETLGNFLFAERGIETVLAARQRFLKPGGLLFPAAATFCLAPFEDARAHQGRLVKASNLWTCRDFFGVDLSCMEERSRRETFSRPLSDQFHPDQLRADACTRVFDFHTMRPEELRRFDVPFSFRAKATCLLHGLAGWFEAHFEGSSCSVILSTSPWDTLTHWWATRLMLLEPLAANEGQEVSGLVGFEASEGNTYRCRLVMESGGARRELDGMDLAESDGSNRNPQHKMRQVTEHAKVSIVDWEATRAAPTLAESLVEDPLREAKLAAARSEAAARVGAGRAPRGRELGSQIRVGGASFLLVDDPELCARLTQPAAALVLQGSLDGALLLMPQEQPSSCLVELSTDSAGVRPRCWLPYERGLEHMRAFVLRHQAPGTPEALGEEEAEALEAPRLAAYYATMKQARAAMRARARRPCLA